METHFSIKEYQSIENVDPLWKQLPLFMMSVTRGGVKNHVDSPLISTYTIHIIILTIYEECRIRIKSGGVRSKDELP